MGAPAILFRFRKAEVFARSYPVGRRIFSPPRRELFLSRGQRPPLSSPPAGSSGRGAFFVLPWERENARA